MSISTLRSITCRVFDNVEYVFHVFDIFIDTSNGTFINFGCFQPRSNNWVCRKSLPVFSLYSFIVCVIMSVYLCPLGRLFICLFCNPMNLVTDRFIEPNSSTSFRCPILLFFQNDFVIIYVMSVFECDNVGIYRFLFDSTIFSYTLFPWLFFFFFLLNLLSPCSSLWGFFGWHINFNIFLKIIDIFKIKFVVSGLNG